MDAANLAKKLAGLGVQHGKVTEADEQYDGQIVISSKVHITVGRQAIAVAESPDGEEFMFFTPRSAGQVAQLVQDIKEAEAFEF